MSAGLDSHAYPEVRTSVTSVDDSLDWTSIEWVAPQRLVMRSTPTEIVAWHAEDGSLAFRIAPPAGGIRNVTLDAERGHFYLGGIGYAVERYDLATGKKSLQFECNAFPRSILVIKDRAYVGLDDGTVVTFDAQTGQLLRQLGDFGAEVYLLRAESDALMWVGTSTGGMTLVDIKSGAKLSFTQLPKEAFLFVRGGPLSVGVAGYNAISHLTLRRSDATLACLKQELACRIPFALQDGLLQPRSLDLGACAKLCR